MQAWALLKCSLCERQDFQWLLDISPGGSSPVAGADPDSLCAFIELIFNQDDASQFEALFQACGRWPALGARFSWLFDGIDYHSPEAQQQRQTHLLMKSYEDRRPPPVTPPPAERVQHWLRAYDCGDVSAWWRLNLDLTLSAESTHYGSDLDCVITSMAGWRDADDGTRKAIVSVAECYLFDAESQVDQVIGTTQFRYGDLAAFRALILLKQVRPDVYACLPHEVWRNWAPVAAIVPYDTGNDDTALVQEVIAQASTAAAAEFAKSVVRIVQLERAAAAKKPEGEQQNQVEPFHVLRTLDNCWGNSFLKIGLFGELSNSENSPAQFQSILRPLIKASFEPARTSALALLADRRPEKRDYVLAAASELLSTSGRVAWPTIWEILQSDTEFGRKLFLDLAYYYRLQANFYVALTETELGELYVWLEQTFPRAEEARLTGQARFVGARDMVGDLRDGILRHLVNLGTAAAVQEMRRVVGRLPSLNWLPYQLNEAEQIMRIRTWSPLTTSELLELTGSRRGVLIQTPDHLRQLLIEALRQYEAELHGEQTPVRLLWDRQANGMWRPVEEDAISDDVKRFLQRTLNSRGVLPNREVEIGRAAGAPIGQRTDIRVDAFRRSEDGTQYDVITAVVETKGCWNAELLAALETQLYQDYLVRLGAPVGIYLVGWFDKPKWDDDDSRKRRVPNLTMDELQSRLHDQAINLPAGVLVDAVVLDCHIHGRD